MAEKQSNKGLNAEKLRITIPLTKVKGQLDSIINKATKEVIQPLKNQLDEMQYLPKEKPAKTEKSAEGTAEKPKRAVRPEWATHDEAVKKRDELRKKLNASKKELPDDQREAIKAQLKALGESDKAVELYNKISEASKDQVRFRAVAFSALACGLQYMLDALCQHAKTAAGPNKVTPIHLLSCKVRDSPMYTYLGCLPAYCELVDFKSKHDECKRLEREFGARWAGFENTSEPALLAKREAESAAISRSQAPSEFTFSSRSPHAARYTKSVAETLDALYPKVDDAAKPESKADKLFCEFVATLLAQFVDRMCPYLKLCIHAADSKTVDAYMVTESLEVMAQDCHSSAADITSYINARLEAAKVEEKAVEAKPEVPAEAPVDAVAAPKKLKGRRAKAAAPVNTPQ